MACGQDVNCNTFDNETPSLNARRTGIAYWSDLSSGTVSYTRSNTRAYAGEIRA